MKLVRFPEQTNVIAEDQPEYLPMPVYRRNNIEGEIICCWQLTMKERLALLFTGKLWHSIWTLHQSLQPQLLAVTKPEMPPQ